MIWYMHGFDFASILVWLVSDHKLRVYSYSVFYTNGMADMCPFTEVS